jgi:hypothetical protein
MYLEIWLLIGLLRNKRSMCRILSLLVLFFLSPCFGFLMYLLGFLSSIPQFDWEKRFDVVVVVALGEA